MKDRTGRIAPIVLKVVKKSALIGDMEREWDAGQKISQLADRDGNLPGGKFRLGFLLCPHWRASLLLLTACIYMGVYFTQTSQGLSSLRPVG